MSETVIETEALYKFYGNFPALDGITCEVPSGISGLVGNNGAGKTTLLRILLGLTSPTFGAASVFGISITDQDLIRQKVGYMSELDTHIPDVTGKKFVAHLGQVCGLSRTAALQRSHDILSYAQLAEERHRKIKTYSKGMRQKLKLAAALVHSPQLLLLDEPTDGLDPGSRVIMLNLIKKLYAEHGINILISSHILPDIERIGNYLVVVHKGKLILADEITKLLFKYQSTAVLTLQQFNLDSVRDFATALTGQGISCKINSYSQIEVIADKEEVFDNILKISREMNIKIESMGRHKLNLDEIFLGLFTEENIKKGQVAGR